VRGPFEYRRMKRGEETMVYNLALRVFEEFVAPQFSEEGVREFRNHIDPHIILRRSQSNHFILIATTEKEIAGMIEPAFRINPPIRSIFHNPAPTIE